MRQQLFQIDSETDNKKPPIPEGAVFLLFKEAVVSIPSLQRLVNLRSKIL